MMFHSSQDNQINVTWIGRQQPEHLMFHSSQDNQINVTAFGSGYPFPKPSFTPHKVIRLM